MIVSLRLTVSEDVVTSWKWDAGWCVQVKTDNTISFCLCRQKAFWEAATGTRFLICSKVCWSQLWRGMRGRKLHRHSDPAVELQWFTAGASLHHLGNERQGRATFNSPWQQLPRKDHQEDSNFPLHRLQGSNNLSARKFKFESSCSRVQRGTDKPTPVHG